jgi:hypothetical protein
MNGPCVRYGHREIAETAIALSRQPAEARIEMELATHTLEEGLQAVTDDIKPMSAERLADIKDCLRRYGEEHTLWNIVSPEEAFQILDLAAAAMIDATTIPKGR